MLKQFKFLKGTSMKSIDEKYLQNYIHNIKQLQQAIAKLGLTEADIAAREALKAAERYLEFIRSYHR